MRRGAELSSSIPLPGTGPAQPRSDWSTLKRLFPYLWDYKWRALAALAFMVAAKVANVGVPLLLKTLIDAMNVARYFIPHVLCLSTSSPFWMGRNTGLKSYRSIIFRHFPRSGIPPSFNGWHDLENFVDTLVRTNCIPDGTKLWWDARPNWKYPTLEFRVCDVCTRVDEAVCIAALFQAIIAKLWKLRRDNLTFRMYPYPLIEENKWRAVRFGLDGKLIDFGKEQEMPARELISEMLQWFVDDGVAEIGSPRARE